MRLHSAITSSLCLVGSLIPRNTMAAFSSCSFPCFRVRVSGSGVPSVNAEYEWTTAEKIPDGFAKVCNENGWNVSKMWSRLNGGRPWLCSKKNAAYIYWNGSDGHWWIDEPGGLGVYIAPSTDSSKPPSQGWKLLKQEYAPIPLLEFLENQSG